MSAKIADVARACGVSMATVSRALRNTPGVSPATRSQVQAAAQALGYVMMPGSAGRSVGASHRVAITMLGLNTWFFGETLTWLTHRLGEVGLAVEVHVVANASARRTFFATQATRTRVVGMVLVGLTLSPYELKALEGMRAPCVGLHTNLPTGSSVQIDDLAVGRAAAAHLIGLGHRRLAMICSAPSETSPAHQVSRRRSVGFWQVVAEAGMDATDELQVSGLDTPSGGATAMARLLSLAPFPSAVFVHSDEMALGALATASAAGLAVPQDLSLISVDDHPLADVFGLTTFRQDVRAQATATANLLLDLIHQARPTAEPDIGDPYLVIRRTTAHFPSARPATRDGPDRRGESSRPPGQLVSDEVPGGDPQLG
jgi:LacI family transcriptional regulator, repressor for deo operon, udp, cdd, tsx, nupC, and nupG